MDSSGSKKTLGPAADGQSAAQAGAVPADANDATHALPRSESSSSDSKSAGSKSTGSGSQRVPEISATEKTVISKRAPMATPAPMPARSVDPGRMLAGEQLGHFRLEEFVGSGGMGAVYRATDLTLGRSVALKVVSRDQTDEDTLRRFRNEAQSAARLDHPNIARVYFVGEDKGWSYIVFEFIEGVNIRELVEHKGPLPLDEAVSYTLDIAEALEHAARRDVVHRDIKPSNILITPEGRAKLVDMGLARLHQVEAPSHDLTQSGMTLGTFDYISPEQARDPRAADVRSDLYSLGCTLYFMLTGLPPFPEGTVLQKLLSHTSDPAPDPRQYRPELPESLTRVVTKLLAKQPIHRYQEPRELIVVLMGIAQEQGLPIISRSATWYAPSDQQESLWERHAPWAVPVTLLLMIVIAMELVSNKGESIVRSESKPNWSATPATPSDTLRQGTVNETAKVTAPGFPIRKATIPTSPSTTSESKSTPPSDRNSDSPRASPESPSSQDARASRSDATSPSPATPKNPATDSTDELGPVPPESAVPKTLVTNSPDTKTPQSNSPDTKLPDTKLPETKTPETKIPETKILETKSSETKSPEIKSSDPKIPETKPSEAKVGSASEPSNTGIASNESTASVPSTSNVDASERRPPIKRLVVGVPEAGITDARYAANLPAALRELATLVEVETIELTRDELVEEPMTIRSKRPIVIRNAEGIHPTITFRPRSRSPSTNSVLRIVGGDVTFQGIHWSVDLSGGAGENWSLFHLEMVNAIRFRNSVLTLDNHEERSLASFISIGSSKLSMLMMPTENGVTLPHGPDIDLQRCIVRGQATLVQSTEGLPFRLTWRNGLFFSTEQMLSVRSAANQAAAGRLDVDLRNLMIRSDRGLAVIQSEDVAQHNCVLNLRNCAVLHDETQPLISHNGVESLEMAQQSFAMRGEENVYPLTRTLWSVQPRAAERRDFAWENRVNEVWYTERLATRNVTWERPRPADRAVHAHGPRDYMLSDRDRTVYGDDVNDMQNLLEQTESDRSEPKSGNE